jgi:hypothetical protein
MKNTLLFKNIKKILQIQEIINRILKPPKTPKHTKLKIYNTLALPTLLHGNETWAARQQDKYRIVSAEMKFIRRTAKYT